MAFVLQSGSYRSSRLSGLAWLEHGFGTVAGSPLGDEDAATLRQIHSNIVCEACQAGDRQREGDGLVTNIPGLWVAVRTADCLPILLADPVERVVAAVHAGWRGTVAEIAKKAVERMVRDYGSKPGNLIAAIGPGIGRCCFKVGPEVTQHFLPAEIDFGSGNPMVDLKLANRRQLLKVGLNPDGIDISPECTMCTAGFHSFRRDQTAGRLVSGIKRRIGAV